MANWQKKLVINPVKQMLGRGATPERLAWSLAVGVVVGVNPLLGSTTLVTLALAGTFRLNVVASQLMNHLAYPLELLLFPVFVASGSMVFSTGRLPLGGQALWDAVRQHPWDTTLVLWRWEWHALVVWAAFAAVMLPALAMGLRPVLAHMLGRMNRERAVLS
jgi:uncharacterized protein (DUF2062 family)